MKNKIGFFVTCFVFLVLTIPSTVLAAENGVSYSTHSSDIGWEAAVNNGVSAGHENSSHRVEAFQAQLVGIPGTIEYNAHVQNIGWMTPTTNGQIIGTTGRSLQVEAVNFYLYGEAKNTHDVYYRVYSKGIGWLGWAKNGQNAGTSGGSVPIQALQVKVLAKNAPAPGSTTDVFRDLNSTPAPAPTPTPSTPQGGTSNSGKVVAQPGLRTVQNFLATALLPVGQTSYVFGGGWNEPDTGAGIPAVTIGVWPQWKPFFDQQNAAYDYTTTKFQIYNGLDCSGYVGWAVYNIMNSTGGGAGEVYLADRQAKVYADKGYGSYTGYGQVTQYLPGDVVSMNYDAHVYIVVGTCPDGSVVLVHSSPPGVMLTGTLSPDGSQSQATQLARTYMQRYYPEYYSRYNSRLDRGHYYLLRTSKMSWSPNWTGDPDGIRNLDAAGVLRRLFNEE